MKLLCNVMSYMILKVTPVSERFQSRVNPCVLPKVSFISETLSTLITIKRILSLVNCQVILKSLFSCEALLTQFAGETLLSSVSPHLDIKVFVMFKTLSTLRATE